MGQHLRKLMCDEKLSESESLPSLPPLGQPFHKPWSLGGLEGGD